MKIIAPSPHDRFKAMRMTCNNCEAVLEIEDKDWVKGTYGSEMVTRCPTCAFELVKPGTEYQGDF